MTRFRLASAGCVALALCASVSTYALPLAAEETVAAEQAVPVRGIVRALDKASLSTDLMARVTHIGFRTGEAFRKGDLLLSFDCDRYRAESQAAEAAWLEMKLMLLSNQKLQKFQAVGRHDVEISKARVAKAEAEARSLKSRVTQCDVKAPFDGRVAELSLNVFEQPQANTPFMTIVGADHLEIELIVPSRWLSWLKPGTEFSFDLDETAKTYSARVVRLGAAVDAISQMVKVIAHFDTQPKDVLSGMSGNALFSGPQG